MPPSSSSSSSSSSPLAQLPPAYFSMVMATGVVSIGAWHLGLTILALSLFGLNIGAYVVLLVLYAVRLLRYPREFASDYRSHSKGAGFLTIVAATAILGAQFVILDGNPAVAIVLWILAIVLWLALIYSILAIFTIKERKPRLDHGINGSWLLAVVATQSIAVLSALLASKSGAQFQLELNFLALSMWLWGGMLYIWMMSLIFYRYTFFPIHPDDLSPPYWINMGAMATSALAGSLLSSNAADASLLLTLKPFIDGFTIFYWASGTWWIPMLAILGLWRHAYKHYPLHYQPLYWGAVFPLGMYATSTLQLAKAMDLAFLDIVTYGAFAAALATWAVLLIGLLRVLSLYRRE